MSSFNVEKYVPTINSILRLSDLSTISAKKIRRALAQEFPNDEIAQNKSILDKRILDCFSVIRKEREGSSDEEEQKPLARPAQDLLKSDLLHPSSPAPKRKFGSSSPPISSPPVAKKPRVPPPVPRAKPKSAPVVKEAYDSDEDAKFAAELDLALNSTGRRTRGAAGGTRTKPRPKKKVAKNGEEGEKKKRAPNPNNAFHAPMLLSPQLTDVVFEKELSRPMVVKKLWDYIKSNNLQNPDNRREILCDDKLRALFNVDKVHMFTMNKVLSNHMWSKADVVGGGDTSTPKKSETALAPASVATPSTSNPSPKRNGKHIKSDARVQSDSEPESKPEDQNDSDEESRFSDSEDDR